MGSAPARARIGKCNNAQKGHFMPRNDRMGNGVKGSPTYIGWYGGGGIWGWGEGESLWCVLRGNIVFPCINGNTVLPCVNVIPIQVSPL